MIKKYLLLILITFIFIETKSMDKVIGLQNPELNNACFINSTIQSLFSLDKLNSLLTKNAYPKYSNSTLSKYLGLYNDYKQYLGDSLNPNYFLTFIRNKYDLNSAYPISEYQHDDQIRYRQEDAHEFLSRLINDLIDEQGEELEKLIQIKLQSDIYFTKQNIQISSNIEVQNYLPVEIVGDKLSSCLDSFFKKENLENYKYNNEVVDANKQYKIIELPEYLIIQLKRFDWQGNKITKNIDIPTEKLDLKKYLLDGNYNKNTTYNLVSIIAQSGGTLESGHYISYAKRGNKWYKFDDEEVEEISKPPSGNIIENDNYEYVPYILFYEKEKPKIKESAKTRKRKRKNDTTSDDIFFSEIEEIAKKEKYMDKLYRLKSLINNYTIPDELKEFEPSGWLWKKLGNPWNFIGTENEKIDKEGLDALIRIAQEFIKSGYKKKQKSKNLPIITID